MFLHPEFVPSVEKGNWIERHRNQWYSNCFPHPQLYAVPIRTQVMTSHGGINNDCDIAIQV